tara:strand:- start:46 stop:801 length:756 start_codon:yes stop_codon:yes gene_type:complete
MNSIILHIPHSSKLIPKKYLNYFFLNQTELEEEINLMTDHFTKELFNINLSNISSIVFPVSRLLVDPERFEVDKDEIMSEVGMGCIYEKTSHGKNLKDCSEIREILLDKYYRPHHKNFYNLVKSKLDNSENVIIFDCHSFPLNRLPYEVSKVKNRPEICIGTDAFHTPKKIKNMIFNNFKSLGFTVDLNSPFSGSIVPLPYYKKNKKVISIMIEVRRDIYMDEKTYKKNKTFNKIHNALSKVIGNISKIEV